MATQVIKLRQVTKHYGSSRGIEAVSLEVSRGEIFGFLGPNGAGKTTTISLLVDLIRPTNGRLQIFGLDCQADSLEVHRRIGFLTDDMALDKGLTGWQQLKFFGSLRGNFDQAYVRELAERLNCNLQVRFRALSRGNRQKIGLISALMHRPELLILDEPTSGLDPLIQAEFNKLMLERRKAGLTTFISSHILSEVQEMCDRVAFIKEGRIIAVKALEEIGRDAPSLIRLHSKDQALVTQLRRLDGVSRLRHSDGLVSFTFNGSLDQLLTLLSRHRLDYLNVHDTDLETLFMQFYEGGHV